MNVLHFVFGVCGNATAFLLYLAPMVTFKRILKNKSTEQFSGLPYIMILLKSLFSLWYGLPFVSPNNILLTTINGAGVVIETIYILIFLFNAPRKERNKIGGLFVSVIILFVTMAITSLIAFKGKTRRLFCGLLNAIIIIFMYGSPLSIMITVIKTRSVDYMPFLTSFFVFLSATSWLIFGILGHDPFLMVANGTGCVLGVMQLILYFIYYDRNGKSGSGSSESKTTTDNALDTGHGKGKPQQTQEKVKPGDSTTIGGEHRHL